MSSVVITTSIQFQCITLEEKWDICSMTNFLNCPSGKIFKDVKSLEQSFYFTKKKKNVSFRKRFFASQRLEKGERYAEHPAI